MPDTLIPPGETKVLIPAADTDEWWAEVYEARVQLGRTEVEARSRGRSAPPGDRGVLQAEPNEEVYAHNPSTDTTAKVHLEHNGFLFERQARAIVGSVLTSDDNEASPASDDYAWFHDVGADPSAGISHTFRTPDAADSVVVSVDDADNTFDVAVIFEDGDGNEVTRRDESNSSAYSGSSTTDVFQVTEIASEVVTVEITGAATSADYSVYAR